MIWKSFFPDIVIPEIPLGEHLMSAMLEYGDLVALTDMKSGKEMTFKELRDKALEYTKILWKAGLRKGDIVGLVLPFDFQYAPLFIAIVNCGAVIFGTKLLYKASIYSQLAAIKPTVVVVSEDRYHEIDADIIKEVPSAKLCVSFNQLKELKENSLRQYEDLPCYGAIDVRSDPVIVYQSSGTTGKPKGIVSTHFSIMSTLPLLRCMRGLLPGEVLSNSIRIIHVASLLSLFCSVSQGLKLVFSQDITPSQFFQWVTKYKISVFGVSDVKILKDIVEMETPAECDLSSLTAIMVGGTTFPEHIIQKARDRFGVVTGMGYGMTECPYISGIISNSSPPASVGSLTPNVKAKIEDVDTEEELGVNQRGELCVQSPQMMKGYLVQDGSSSVGVVDGWLHTGDLAYFDERGFLYVVGRIKDSFKMQPGNITVLPAEFESILLRHPKIADAAVAGVPHSDFGEAPKAFVVKKDETLTKEEVLEFFKSQVEGTTTLQGGVEFLDVIPKTELGKALRRVLVENTCKSAKNV